MEEIKVSDELREDLQHMLEVLNQFYSEKGRFPTVQEYYLVCNVDFDVFKRVVEDVVVMNSEAD